MAKAIGNSPYDESVFDYGSMNDDHKEAVKKCLELAEKAGMQEEFLEILRVKFHLSQYPTYDLNESDTWKSFADNEDIGASSGGYTRQNKMNYPYVSLMGDIRDFDKWLAGQITNLQKTVSEKE